LISGDKTSAKYMPGTAIPTLHEKTREQVASDINKAKYFVATTDTWSSSTMEPYLSYSIHIINDSTSKMSTNTVCAKRTNC